MATANFDSLINQINEGLFDRAKANVAGAVGAVKGIGARASGTLGAAKAAFSGNTAGAQAAAQKAAAGKQMGLDAKTQSIVNSHQKKIAKAIDEFTKDLSKLKLSDPNSVNSLKQSLNAQVQSAVKPAAPKPAAAGEISQAEAEKWALGDDSAGASGNTPNAPASVAKTASAAAATPAAASTTTPASPASASTSSTSPQASATASSETPSTDNKATDSGTPGITMYDPKETNPSVRFLPPKGTASAAAPGATATPGAPASSSPTTPASLANPESVKAVDAKLKDLGNQEKILKGLMTSDKKNAPQYVAQLQSLEASKQAAIKEKQAAQAALKKAASATKIDAYKQKQQAAGMNLGTKPNLTNASFIPAGTVFSELFDKLTNGLKPHIKYKLLS